MGPSCHHVFCTLHVSSTCTGPSAHNSLACFFQFLEEMWDAMFVCRKKISYHVSVTWIMVTQPFLLHSHKRTILVVKIIVIFQNSAHHYLQTTSKDAESVMFSYFLFITSHFSTLHYTIVFRGIFLFLFILSTKV